ncbi:uncharacterized protein N0V89_006782 [Didymosphaeria variabile]|uniref:Piwi domain-containing protein n=1 Tax=Didymosphaeria variabile TaxID=1932322 RepID=A0A9W8XK80_9PLEO|nr:uncharacterized protein N0V89_006782 [Didymosphaeria variabile]KAJ4351440.1 hypothetical protein N0V89_006782 [Didymosphaeria variabile]
MVLRLKYHGIQTARAGDIETGSITQFEQFLRTHSGQHDAILVALAKPDYDTHATTKRLADLYYGANWMEDMRDMVLERLRAYRSTSSKFPSAVLFYRDGISESMFEECENREIQAIRDAFNAFGKEHNHPNLKIKLTFVVVGKRHSTRFYPRDRQFTTRNGNLKPGLLVDEVITSYIADRLCDRGRHYLRLWEHSKNFDLPRNDPKTGQSWNEDGIKRWRREMALRLARGEPLSPTNNEPV